MANRKCNILVIEDDPQIRKLMATSLTAEGYGVETAYNGTHGLQALRLGHVDICLLDLGLPDMDGVSIISKVRSFSNLPIIVVSARSEDSDKIGALDAGADDYLTKPFSVEELMARIRVAQRRIAAQIQSGGGNTAADADRIQAFVSPCEERGARADAHLYHGSYLGKFTGFGRGFPPSFHGFASQENREGHFSSPLHSDACRDRVQDDEAVGAAVA